MFKLAIPWKAFVIGFPMILGGMAVGAAIGGWIVPMGIAWFGRNDWSALTQMPRSFWIIPAVPSWYTRSEHTLWNIGFAFSAAGFAAGGVAGERAWRYLVVRKYKWMTNKEVDDFLKRGGDGPKQ